MEHYNFVDLFCGTGGMTLGLEMAGFKCVYANDVDVNSVNTVRANYPQTLATCEPIQFLTEEKIIEYVSGQEIHLVAGGPPCQGFSTIGKGLPEDRKNSLFQYFVGVVKILHPQFVLFENVTGLVAKKNQPILDSIIESFEEIGYTLHIKVLESQHYGVPQKRKRTIIVGSRNGRSFVYPRPICDITFNGFYIPPRTLGGALLELENYLQDKKIEDDLHNVKDMAIKKEIDLERLKCIPEGECIRYQKDEDKYFPSHLKLGVDWKNISEGRLRENHYHRLDRKKTSPTVNTENHYYYHPYENRRFTLRELAIIQSFPPNYIFKGRKLAIKRQIGNAVPPMMMKAIGQEIFNSLKYNNIEENIEKLDVEKVRSQAFIYDGQKALKKYNQQRKRKVIT